MKLSDKQKEFWNAPYHRWNIKHGATRTGKTYLDYFVIPRRVRERMGKEGLVVFLGNTKGTLQRNVIEPMQAIYGASVISSIKSDNTARIFGERVHCLGADNKKHVDRLRGASIKYCYGDEVVTWKQDVFEMLKSRLDKPYSCFDGTCNPEGPRHWFRKFIDSDGDIFSQHYALSDNPFLDPFFVEQLKREHAGTVYYDRYILGNWTLAEGVIYQSFHEKRHVMADLPPLSSITYAVDVGHSNATVFLAVGKARDGRLFVTDEYYHSGRNAERTKSAAAYAKDFAAFQARVMQTRNIPARGVVCVDPSALGFIAALQEAGVSQILRAKNDVLPGISSVASLLDADKLFIHPGCTHLISEFGGYVWDEKAAERGEDKPVKMDDHCLDALRYNVFTLHTNAKARILSKAQAGIF